jgi:hypothetical protein
MLKAVLWRVEVALIGAIVLWQAVSSIIFVFNSIKGLFQ